MVKKTPDTNYPRSRKGRFLPTDGNQLATWLPENTWAAVWSQDANEAEGKVEADLPTVLGEEKLMEETAEVQFWKMESRIKWEMMYGGAAELDWRSPERLQKQRAEGKNICWWRTLSNPAGGESSINWHQHQLDIFNLRLTWNHWSS